MNSRALRLVFMRATGEDGTVACKAVPALVEVGPQALRNISGVKDDVQPPTATTVHGARGTGAFRIRCLLSKVSVFRLSGHAAIGIEVLGWGTEGLKAI